MAEMKGVNLGNWLVLEKWMSPVLFDGVEAEDETWLARTLAPNILAERMKAHRETYITERDFAYLANQGVNSVRIPVPYFIFGDREPFVGCIEYLDRAFRWAEKYEISVLIDLHTAPGSQNGFDNGGICGVCKWAQNPEEVEFVLSVLERLAQRYSEEKALYGIEVINEPISPQMWEQMDIQKRYPPVDAMEAQGSAGVSSEFLRSFYVDAYHRIRRHMKADKAVVLHDGFRLKEWKDFMQEQEFENVVLDTHLYLMMAEMFGCAQDAESYVKYIEESFERDVEEMQQYFPMIVGEWCLFNSVACGADTRGGVAPLEDGKEAAAKNAVAEEERRDIYRKLADAQLKAWDKGIGYYYWSYKLLLDTVNQEKWFGWDSWDFGKCMELGWFSGKL